MFVRLQTPLPDKKVGDRLLPTSFLCFFVLGTLSSQLRRLNVEYLPIQYAFRRHKSMLFSLEFIHFFFLHVVQERISKVVEICRVCLLHLNLPQVRLVVPVDRPALWVYPNHHLHRIYEE